MSHILVTGGTGFVGSNLVKRLLSLGHDVIITGNQTEQQVENSTILEPSLIGIDWKLIRNIDVVFHMSANNDTLCNDKETMLRANVEAAEYLFEKCLDAGCENFIFASSTAVYGDQPAPYIEEKTLLNPLNWYGESKAIFEESAMTFAEDFNVKIVGLRYCNVYGPGESHKGRRASMIYQMIEQMLNNRPPKLFKHGEQRRDYIYVDDVVEANLLAWKYDKSDIFNCGSGKATSFIDVYHTIADAMYHPACNLSDPEWIDNPHPETYQTFTECDMKKAESIGFRPKVSIKEGIKKYVSLCSSCATLGSH